MGFIHQARDKWVAISSSRVSFGPTNKTWGSSLCLLPLLCGHAGSLPLVPPGKPHIHTAAAAAAAKLLQSGVRPHRRQPTRLLHPWDSPGKNTGVGCHFLLQCMKVKSESEVAQLCPTLLDPIDCRLPGSSVHGILQARAREWVVISCSNIHSTKHKIGNQQGPIVHYRELYSIFCNSL